MALHVCENMDPLFSGFGLGYNTIIPPGKEQICSLPAVKRENGRELVMPDRPTRAYVNDINSEKEIARICLAPFAVKDIEGKFTAGFDTELPAECQQGDVPLV